MKSLKIFIFFIFIVGKLQAQPTLNYSLMEKSVYSTEEFVGIMIQNGYVLTDTINGRNFSNRKDIQSEYVTTGMAFKICKEVVGLRKQVLFFFLEDGREVYLQLMNSIKQNCSLIGTKFLNGNYVTSYQSKSNENIIFYTSSEKMDESHVMDIIGVFINENR